MFCRFAALSLNPTVRWFTLVVAQGMRSLHRHPESVPCQLKILHYDAEKCIIAVPSLSSKKVGCGKHSLLRSSQCSLPSCACLLCLSSKSVHLLLVGGSGTWICAQEGLKVCFAIIHDVLKMTRECFRMKCPEAGEEAPEGRARCDSRAQQSLLEGLPDQASVQT